MTRIGRGPPPATQNGHPMELRYTVRRSARRKKLTITVERDRSVVVHAPAAMPDEAIGQAVEAKRQWIREKTRHGRKYREPPHPPGKELVNGESALYLGRSYRIELVKGDAGEAGGVRLDRCFFVPAPPGPQGPPRIAEAPAGRGRLWGPDAGEPPPRPHAVLVAGVNGTGKTTAVARLAHAAAEDGQRTIAAAADTFRAAAIDQLRTWGERLAFDVIAHRQGADPGAVVFDAAEAARARGHDLLLVDTAGRLHNRRPLLDELSKIRRVLEGQLGRPPDEVALVLDATTGQNGLAQARAFAEAVEVTSVILTKLDGSAKGGIAFAVAAELGLPVRFIGTGDGPGDLAPFDAESFVDALLGAPEASPSGAVA